MTISLELTRIFDAPPARVFACFTSKTEMSAWLGPYDIRSEVLELEPRVGGRYRVAMHRPDGGVLYVGGAFQAIEEPNRIAFTWKWEDGRADTLIVVELRDLDGRTEMKFRQEGFGAEIHRDRHIHGWTGSFEKLAVLVNTGIRQQGGKAA